MSQYVQWVEPYSSGKEAVWMLMTVEDVVDEMRREEPRYARDELSDRQVLDDFVAAHWGKLVEWEPL